MFERIIPWALFLSASVSGFAATNVIREVDLRLRDLVYDPGTQKLYGTSRDNLIDLLQLDPQTGAITATFPVGSIPDRLALDNRRGLWIGLNGDGMVRRFNLDTLTAEPTFDLKVGPNTAVLDIAPSPDDNDTFAVIAGRAYLVRDGVLLPDSLAVPFGTKGIAMLGNYLFSELFRARMTPSGLVADAQGPASDFKVADGKIYLDRGEILDPLTLQTTGGFENPIGAVNWASGINNEDNSILFLSFGQAAIPFYLTHFDRSSRKVTGFFSSEANLGNIWETDLVPISTNRVAMWSDQKVFLVDLEPAFERGDLSVTASVQPNPTALGNPVQHTITITNIGPGFILNTVITNLLIGNVRFPEVPEGASFEPSIYRSWRADHYRFAVGLMSPGASRTFRFRVTPLGAGPYTNRVVGTAGYETNLANNTNETVVAVQNPFTNILTRLAPAGADVSQLAYDPQANQLLLGTTNGQLFFLELDQPEIHEPLLFDYAVEHIATAPDVRSAWVNIYGWSSLYQVPLDSGPISREHRLSGLLRDLAASPVDAQVAAFSGATGIQLFDLVNRIGNNSINGSGALRFSSDGKKLYQVLDFDCSLRLFNVSTGSLTLERSFPNVGCHEFFEFGGRLYFDSGLVFDPSTGTTITNLNLPYPSFVVRDPAGPLDILTRTNADWIVRRLDPNSFQEAARVTLGRNFSPSIVISAGTNRIAFRNVPGEVVLVHLANDSSNGRLESLNTFGGVTLRFSTVDSAPYRLEESSSISDPVWTPSGQEFLGNGLFMERTVPNSGTRRFFRLVRLPNQ